ncbi:MAG: hemin uptake protein HemP [Hydrogenophaga sp.]|nr:hemin uptake protein HemP [Hydrogenophaga sp.]
MSPDECTLQQNSRLGSQATPGGASPQAEPAVSSQTLLRGQKAVAIEHNGEVYRLQHTRAGKLILTK